MSDWRDASAETILADLNSMALVIHDMDLRRAEEAKCRLFLGTTAPIFGTCGAMPAVERDPVPAPAGPNRKARRAARRR